jgi:glycosyltransferase involved in cell wall biosynthesis
VTISLDIFGRGSLLQAVQEFADRYSNITYHGFQNKSIVFETWKESDYCLMPSRFLETFGLSALDSLSV